jgi:hypothetical protein
LQRPGEGYDHRDALFGIPPYGGSIQQQLYYAPSNLCSPSTDLSDAYPRTGSNEDPSPPTPPFILMVDRGDCTFVMKVRHAQRAGASGVLIADNLCQCTAQNCTSNDECESAEPLMADDGSGSDISIPAFLVFKQDADPIRKALKANQQVRVEMSFSIPSAHSRVEYDLWTTPKDPISRNFLNSFSSASVALGKDAFFTPHMYIYDGRRAGCQDSLGENQCFNLCTNNGLYCATDPDNDMDRGLSGADVVTESLRRMCVWSKYGSDGVGAPWWDYVREFSTHCDVGDTSLFTSESCIAEAMNKASVDKSSIDKCMADSGGLEGNITNSLLEAELAHRETSGVVVIPTLFVNQSPVRGALSFSTVLKALCAGFAQGSEPSVCKTCASCQDEERCVTLGGHCPSGGLAGNGVSLTTFLGALFVLSLLFLCTGLVQYRRQQRYMRDQVRGIMAEYMPLDGNQRKPTDTSVGIEDDDRHGDLNFTIS